MSDDNDGCGCGCGCSLATVISLILAGLLLWALVFGVTVDGRHYMLGLSCDRGIEFGGW